MYLLKSAEILGFRGSSKPLRIEFDPGVNFIIGRNGTGKTRLMNLLNAALSGDGRELVQITFTQIKLELSHFRSSRHIDVKIEKSTENNVTYNVRDNSKRPVVIKFNSSAMNPIFFWSGFDAGNATRLASSPKDKIASLMEKYIKLSWLSVTRAPSRQIEDTSKDGPLDAKIKQVAKDFGTYFSVLDKDASDATDRFQKNFFLSLLFSGPRTRRINEILHVDQAQEKSAMVSIFSEFGMESTQYQARLDDHFERLAAAASAYDPHTAINAENFLILVNTTLIHDVIKDWDALTSERRTIYSPKETFITVINRLIFGKTLIISNGNQPIVMMGDKEIPLTSLSSGEKQLFVILGEALLQRHQPCIFLADEPELSLHVDWQESLVPSLREISPNSQIIFATHSPDIVGAFQSQTKDLETLA